MRILVIDDDGLAAAITGAVLEELEYDPIIAESVAEARICLANHPDIAMIVCDLHMPETDGLTFLRQLREEGRSLAFILLTGTEMASGSDGRKTIDAADAFVPDICLLKDETLDVSLGDAIAQILASDIRAPR